MEQIEDVVDYAINFPNQFAVQQNWPTLLKLYHRVHKCNGSICARAIRAGNLPMIKVLLSLCPDKFSPYSWAYAAGEGHIAVLDWVHKHRHACDWNRCLQQAAVADRVNVINWIMFTVQPKCPSTSICAAAATQNNLELLQSLRRLQLPWDDFVPVSAVLNGNLPMLRWSLASGCPVSRDLCDAAAAVGDLPIFQYLVRNKFSVSDKAYEELVKHGHIYILEWMYSEKSAMKPTLTLKQLNALADRLQAEADPETNTQTNLMMKTEAVKAWILETMLRKGGASV